MTDKEIRALIEKRRKEWRYGSSTEAKYKVEECDDILELLDSIQEEPVSEDKDLEETISTIKLLTSNTALLTFEYGFRKGAEWQMNKLPKWRRTPIQGGCWSGEIGIRPTARLFVYEHYSINADKLFKLLNRED